MLRRMTIHGCAFVALLAGSSMAGAAEPVPADLGAAGLSQALERLRTTASVLHVVAHPDDEDGALLTYLARGQGARTMLFSLTRGEGGVEGRGHHHCGRWQEGRLAGIALPGHSREE